MTETELRAAIKAGVSGGYLLYGDEDYLKRFYAAKIKESALSECPEGLSDFNCISLTLEDGDFSALEGAISTPPIMAPMKYIELSPPNANAWKEKDRTVLADILSRLAEVTDTVLVMITPRDTLDAGTAKKPSALFKALSKSLTPVEFPLQSGDKLRRWILRHLTEDGITVDEDALYYLTERCAPDMTSLSREIDKLICFEKANGRTHVTKADVDYVVSPGVREDAFALANAMLGGDRTAALRALEIYKKRKEEPLIILASLGRVFSDLLTVCALSEGGAEKAEIAKTLKMHEYKASLYIRAAKDFGMPRINAALKRCLDADRLSKTMSMGYVPLERFVCTIPLGARKGASRG